VIDSLLLPDCAYVQTSAQGEPALVEHFPANCAFTDAMARELEPSTSAASGGEWSAGGPGVRIARAHQSFPGEHCVAVATSRRADFPLPADLFVLQRAVDQAAIAFQGARLLAREQAARNRAEMQADQLALGPSWPLRWPAPPISPECWTVAPSPSCGISTRLSRASGRCNRASRSYICARTPVT